ncbi:MAG: ABC transporter ATP-binding protein [Paludibacteraceae bacterium]|nr:ABC transporter ATP-binding protein [Paludibacteraceae bacterium]
MVEITQLNKHLGGRPILQDIGLHLGRGEVVGLLGRNGVGKTTLMRLMTGALRYDEGSIRIGGMELKEEPVKCARLTGYLAEHNPLYDDMQVGEYLTFAARIRGLDRQQTRSRLDRMSDQLELNGLLDRRISRLSKGQRQRVGLAGAMIHDPELLILDEPTNGLDIEQLAELHRIIRQAGEHKTILLSTHILQEINAVCSRVLIMSQGRIVDNVQVSSDTDIQTRFNQANAADHTAP